MSNPFVKSPLNDINLFAGRKSEINYIRYNLSKDIIPSLMFVGERGVGKTSLLNYSEKYAKFLGIISVRINLTSKDTENVKYFFARIFLQTCLKLIENNFLGGVGGIIHNILKKYQIDVSLLEAHEKMFETLLPNSYFTIESLISDFSTISQLMNESGKEFKKLIILIDEVEKIYDSQEIIENIRYFIQNPDSYVSFIFSGDKSYQTKQWEVIFQTYRGVIEIIDIDNFQSNQDVEDYFKKLLTSIKWDEAKDLVGGEKFKDFFKTCFELYLLTRGKPAFISSIAYKMYERYELKITKKLTFDKDLRQDLKLMLTNSGSIASSRIERIELLSDKYKAWVKYLFSCRFSRLDDFYHNIKYIFHGSNLFLTEDEFIHFIKHLFEESKILVLEAFNNESRPMPIGFVLSEKKNIFDRKYDIYFGDPDVAESTKFWLQIDGNFKFERRQPRLLLIRTIFTDFLTDQYQIRNHEIEIPEKFNSVITHLTSNSFSILENFEFSQVRAIYSLLTSAKNTKDKITRTFSIITLRYQNETSKSYLCWAVNYKNKLIQVNLGNASVEKWTSKFNSLNYFESGKINISITKDVIDNFDLANFENYLLTSNNDQFTWLVIGSKIEDLSRYFEKEENTLEFQETVDVLYNLFLKGVDISIQGCNNLGFCFLCKNDFEKAESLLMHAIMMFSQDNFTKEIDMIQPSLPLYNFCILCLKLKDFERADKYHKILSELEIDRQWEVGFLVLASVEDGELKFVLERDTILYEHIDVLGNLIQSMKNISN
jgi:hypothetical protein